MHGAKVKTSHHAYKNPSVNDV